jgi:hypothetical protein
MFVPHEKHSTLQLFRPVEECCIMVFPKLWGRGHQEVLRVYSKGSPNSHSFATVPALGAGACFPVPLDY